MKKGLISLLILCVYLCNGDQSITILGSGYVGLVTGTCLAELGNTVICADVDTKKIDSLNKGIVPIYEPYLEAYIRHNTQAHRLQFTADIDYAIQQAEIIFITVGTPVDSEGEVKLCYIHSALLSIIRVLKTNPSTRKFIVVKSTVPITTNQYIEELFTSHNISKNQYALISNPEFLREGQAISDFFYPDRIVLGSHSPEAIRCLRHLHQPIIENGVPVIVTDPTTAEAIKFASNAFLALKIAFINECANLCDVTDATISVLAKALGLDTRIGPDFLNPGPGFGGSCFPKDLKMLLQSAKKYDVSFHTIAASLKANEIQKHKAVKKLNQLLNHSIEGKTIALLGLSFKANTDDVRDSPALTILEDLLNSNAYIQAYDPMAAQNAQSLFPENNSLKYAASMQEAVKNADALIIATEWEEFKKMHLDQIAPLMLQQNIIDMRNLLSVEQARKYGFNYISMGNGSYFIELSH